MKIENLIDYEIICRSKSEFIDCAKLLIKLDFHVVNFDGEHFIKNEDSTWTGMSYDYQEHCWGRFFTNNFKFDNYIELKYLTRKDKLLKINEI